MPFFARQAVPCYVVDLPAALNVRFIQIVDACYQEAYSQITSALLRSMLLQLWLLQTVGVALTVVTSPVVPVLFRARIPLGHWLITYRIRIQCHLSPPKTRTVPHMWTVFPVSFGRIFRPHRSTTYVGAAVTGQLADMPTSGLPTCRLDNSRSRVPPKERKLSMQSRRWHPRVVQSAACPVRELTSPRVVQSASWRIRELSSNRCSLLLRTE